MDESQIRNFDSLVEHYYEMAECMRVLRRPLMAFRLSSRMMQPTLKEEKARMIAGMIALDKSFAQ
jgi:hypothetical protein